jgi:hypothetical protein
MPGWRCGTSGGGCRSVAVCRACVLGVREWRGVTRREERRRVQGPSSLSCSSSSSMQQQQQQQQCGRGGSGVCEPAAWKLLVQLPTRCYAHPLPPASCMAVQGSTHNTECACVWLLHH